MAKLRDTSLFADANLVALYEMENGALTADSKGSNTLTNNNTVGTETSAPLYGTGAADYGTANTNKSLSIATGLGVDLSGAHSVSMWVKVRTAPSAQIYMFSDWRSTTGTARYLQVAYQESGGKKLYIDPSGSAFNVNSIDLGTSTWQHLVATVSAGGTVTVYLNGVSVGTGTRGTSTSTNNTYLGTDTGGGNPASIYLDDVSFFSKELTAAEVSRIYNGELVGGFYMSV